MAIDGIGSNPFESLGLSTAKEVQQETDEGKLLMEDYLSLMTEQLKNRDPLAPMENGDFLGQIAQFAAVSGIGDLNTSFSDFSKSMQSDQALQGSALVGHSVLVPSSIGTMTAANGLKGQINVVEPVSDLKVQIYSETGTVVKTIEMGSASGYTNFTWNGFDDGEQALTPGVYQFKATGTLGGENVAFAPTAKAKGESVLVGSGNQGLTMNLAGIGSVPFSEAQEII